MRINERRVANGGRGIGHLINKDMLRDCHMKMDGDKAVGIDGVTKEDYGRNLEENLEGLVERLKKKSYKPKPARRVMYRPDLYASSEPVSIVTGLGSNSKKR